MAHAAVAFTDQGTSIRERAKNIISPAVDHASHFEQLRFMREELKAEKDRLQLLLNLTTQVSPDVELRQLLRTASATLRVPLAALASHCTPEEETRGRTLKEAEREHIKSILKETNGLVSGPNGAAARLGMKRSTLNFRMKKLGIIRPPMQ